MPLRIGRGRNEITLEGPLADGLEREIRDMLGPVLDEMERRANRVLDEAVASWPRRSGRSAEAWRVELRLQPTDFSVEVVLVNPTGYTRFIKSTRISDGPPDEVRRRSPLVDLVRKPLRAAGKDLERELPDLLASLLEDLF